MSEQKNVQKKQNGNLAKRTTLWIALTALFMAMNIAISAIGVPVPGGHLYLTDAVIVLAAILLDPVAAFVVGGVGAMLGDLLASYQAAMFVSLATHGLQAVAISLFAHYILKKHRTLSSGIGAAIGGVIMVVGFSLGRAFVYATPEYAWIKLPYEILQAALGASLGMLLAWKFGLVKLYEKLVGRL